MTYSNPSEVPRDNGTSRLQHDQVRILQLNLRTGETKETDEMRSHPSERVYFVTGGTPKVYLSSGQAVEAEASDGRAQKIRSSDIRAIINESRRE